MLRNADSEPGSRIARIAWLTCFAVPLALLAILWVASSAHALADAQYEAKAESIAVAAFETEQREESEEGCLESEAEEGELFEVGEEECEAEEEGEESIEECPLRTARAHIVAYPDRDRLRLALGYTAYVPTRATVELRLRSGERLGTASRHLGHSGVLRLSKHIGRGEMARATASHRFTVTLRLPEAAGECRRYEAPAAVLFK
jgi:hypothetical protein